MHVHSAQYYSDLLHPTPSSTTLPTNIPSHQHPLSPTSLHNTDQLHQLNDVKRQRLQALSYNNPSIIQQYEWVQHHVNKPNSGFIAPVLGPIAVEIDVQNPRHAAMLEQMVFRTIWGMFVAQHPDDQQRLITEMDRALGQKPAVTCILPEDASRPIEHPGGPASGLATWGITHTLDEVFDAPAPIKHTLCNESNIHKAYVGTEYVWWGGVVHYVCVLAMGMRRWVCCVGIVYVVQGLCVLCRDCVCCVGNMHTHSPMHRSTEQRIQDLFAARSKLSTVFTPIQRHNARTSYYNNTMSVSSEATLSRPEYVHAAVLWCIL